MDTWLLSLTFCTMHLSAVSHPVDFQSDLSVGGPSHKARISVVISSGATLKTVHQRPHQSAQCWGVASENEAIIQEISNYMLHDMSDNFVVYLPWVNLVSGSQAWEVGEQQPQPACTRTHKTQLLFKYEMLLLYTRKLRVYYTLKPFILSFQIVCQTLKFQKYKAIILFILLHTHI
jgi:hypothetical protein